MYINSLQLSHNLMYINPPQARVELVYTNLPNCSQLGGSLLWL